MKKNNLFTRISVLTLTACVSFAFAACAGKKTDDPAKDATPVITQDAGNQSQDNNTEDPKNETQDEKTLYDGKLVFDHSMELTYAKTFSVDYYKAGYKLIKVDGNEKQLLVVPEGMKVPADLTANTVVLQQPINNLLISSTPTVSLINAIGALDRVTLTTYDVDSWYIDEVKAAMNAGKLAYVGNYKSPDYEMIVAQGTKFGVFSTMLTEDVAEKLKEMDVNYILDQASSEDHPLARVEWAKLYGALFNLEDAAEKHFEAQKKLVEDIAAKEATGKTVAIFYITSKGDLYARNTDDYMAKMIKLGGGEYVLDGKVGVGQTGTVKMEAEAFFDGAKDADEIIYIWSMGGKPETIADLVAKSPILADMKAVKNGNVWCTTPDYFQISCTIGNMINDINLMLNADASQEKFTYLYKIK